MQWLESIGAVGWLTSAASSGRVALTYILDAEELRCLGLPEPAFDGWQNKKSSAWLQANHTSTSRMDFPHKKVVFLQARSGLTQGRSAAVPDAFWILLHFSFRQSRGDVLGLLPWFPSLPQRHEPQMCQPEQRRNCWSMMHNIVG